MPQKMSRSLPDLLISNYQIPISKKIPNPNAKNQDQYQPAENLGF